MNLHLPEGYVERLDALAYDDTDSDGLCQQAVYDYAIKRAKELGARQIADFGCGNAKKLLPHRDRFSITGVDLNAVVDQLRGQVGFEGSNGFRTHDHDFSRQPLKFSTDGQTLLICADVIEHLVDPTYLLQSIRHALRNGALRAVISTPCRTHHKGVSKTGPPNNPCHVREWSCKEFLALMAEARLDVLSSTHVAERPDSEGKGTFLVEVVDAV